MIKASPALGSSHQTVVVLLLLDSVVVGTAGQEVDTVDLVVDTVVLVVDTVVLVEGASVAQVVQKCTLLLW